MSRDYAAEMRTLIDSETSHGSYVSRVIAREIVEKLEANDPEMLTGWLMEHAEQLIWGAINQRDRSTRSKARTSGPRSAFADAAADHEAGSSEALGHWLDCPYVVEDGSRRALATLTKADLLFVAETYDARARQNDFEAVFMRALAKKVRTGTVADHFDEAKLAELRASLS
jgi:hypothetical protein